MRADHIFLCYMGNLSRNRRSSFYPSIKMFSAFKVICILLYFDFFEGFSYRKPELRKTQICALGYMITGLYGEEVGVERYLGEGDKISQRGGARGGGDEKKGRRTWKKLYFNDTVFIFFLPWAL